MFNKNKVSEAFLKEAKNEIETAYDLMEKNRFSQVILHAQTGVEKLLKAALIMKGIIIEEHKIWNIFIENFGAEFEINKIEEKVLSFERQGVKPRYPLFTREDLPIWIPSEMYNKEDAEEALKNASLIFKEISKFLKEKYAVKC